MAHQRRHGRTHEHGDVRHILADMTHCCTQEKLTHLQTECTKTVEILSELDECADLIRVEHCLEHAHVVAV